MKKNFLLGMVLIAINFALNAQHKIYATFDPVYRNTGAMYENKYFYAGGSFGALNKEYFKVRNFQFSAGANLVFVIDKAREIFCCKEKVSYSKEQRKIQGSKYVCNWLIGISYNSFSYSPEYFEFLSLGKDMPISLEMGISADIPFSKRADRKLQLVLLVDMFTFQVRTGIGFDIDRRQEIYNRKYFVRN